MADAAKSLGKKVDGIRLATTAAKAVEEVRVMLQPGMAVYLKGSRGMRLETVEQALTSTD
jgi:UDP-N-acetylmuramyl pentapeptide synthase